MQEILVRFLNAIHSIDHPFLDEGTLDQLYAPVITDRKRVAGIDIRNPRIQNLTRALEAMMALQYEFQVSDLAEKVRSITGQSKDQYSTRQAAYDLKKFRAKGFVKRVPKSRRYICVPDEIRKVLGSIIIREKVIKPVIAGVCKPRRGPKPKRVSPCDRHYESLRITMNDLFKTFGLSA